MHGFYQRGRAHHLLELVVLNAPRAVHVHLTPELVRVTQVRRALVEASIEQFRHALELGFTGRLDAHEGRVCRAATFLRKRRADRGAFCRLLPLQPRLPILALIGRRLPAPHERSEFLGLKAPVVRDIKCNPHRLPARARCMGRGGGAVRAEAGGGGGRGGTCSLSSEHAFLERPRPLGADART